MKTLAIIQFKSFIISPTCQNILQDKQKNSLQVVLYGRETWTLTSMKVYQLQVGVFIKNRTEKHANSKQASAEFRIHM